MIRTLLLTGLALCLLLGILRVKAEEGSAAAELAARLDAIEHLRGNFEQRQYDEAGELLLESSGRFRLLRPGYFAWEISEPDKQLVIADKQYLWHFDQELETVTRRPLAGHEAMSPMQVLGGDQQLLEDLYTISKIGEQSFSLVPTAGNAGFKQLTLVLEDGTLSAMEILDQLNQRVEIGFERLDRETPLEPGDFEFSPPEGADIFYYDE